MIDSFEKTVIFLKLLYQKSFEEDIFSRAAQVAFYFSFSLFPLLFFLVSLFGLVLESTAELKTELYQYLQQLMPITAFDLVQKTVDEIVENSSSGKLTIGILVAIWSSSAGMDSIRIALNSVYGLKEKRSWWTTKLLAIIMTLSLASLSAIVLGIVFYGWQLVQIGLNAVNLPISSPFILVVIQWITILLVMLFACELIYNFIPSFEKTRWKWITPGSIVAIILWLLLTNGFRLYLQYFNTYNKTYGSLGAVIILMLWLYLTALVILIGGAINSILEEISKETSQENSKVKKPEKPETADQTEKE